MFHWIIRLIPCIENIADNFNITQNQSHTRYAPVLYNIKLLDYRTPFPIRILNVICFKKCFDLTVERRGNAFLVTFVMHKFSHSSPFLALTAPIRRNMFLPIYVTFCDAQNRPNKCNSYAKGFSVDDRPIHSLLIPTTIDCIHSMSSLQMCPVLDAISLCTVPGFAQLN